MGGRPSGRRRRRTVGRARGSAWRPVFLFAVLLLGLSVVLVAVVSLGNADDDAPGPTLIPRPVESETPTPVPPGTAAPTVQATPTERPTASAGLLPCGDILVPIGKERFLDPSCVPPGLVLLPERMSYFVDLPIALRPEAAAAAVAMLEAAQRDGLTIVARSAYRSYEDQERTYRYNVATYGQDYADRSSARPGHSEHQLGTAADLTSASNGYQLEGFEHTPEGRWIAENAARFGFVISYPEGSEPVTGYIFEPWHVRFVGATVAAEIVASGLAPVIYLERH